MSKEDEKRLLDELVAIGLIDDYEWDGASYRVHLLNYVEYDLFELDAEIFAIGVMYGAKYAHVLTEDAARLIQLPLDELT